jgi:hypothetical protein
MLLVIMAKKTNVQFDETFTFICSQLFLVMITGER